MSHLSSFTLLISFYINHPYHSWSICIRRRAPRLLEDYCYSVNELLQNLSVVFHLFPFPVGTKTFKLVLALKH